MSVSYFVPSFPPVILLPTNDRADIADVYRRGHEDTVEQNEGWLRGDGF